MTGMGSVVVLSTVGLSVMGYPVLLELFPHRLLWVPDRCLVLVEVESNLCKVVFDAVHGLFEVFWVDHDVHVIHVR